MKEKKQLTDYTPDVQLLFLRMMLSSPELYTRVMNILNPDNFEKSLKPVVKFFKEHSDKYKVLPDPLQVTALCGVSVDIIGEMHDGHGEWFLTEFEQFTKRQELERAILKSADLLDKGEYGPVEKLIKDAVQISLQKDLGMDYFADPRARLMELKNAKKQVSTGWPNLDYKLYGGMGRGELNLFLGQSGAGKSLFMQNLAVNWVNEGMNGVYITLELSEELCSLRLDAMFTGVASRDVLRNIDDVELKLKIHSKKSGNLRVKYMPAQSNSNDIRAYCKELAIQTKKKLDFICIDYLDLMTPATVKVSTDDVFGKDKYVSEEVRNLAKELNVLLVTASQLNRGSTDEVEFNHSHVAGGKSKIDTSDNVFGIFTSRSMRERGQYQLQLMKTRSSSGVGSKIDLEFNVDTLRIVSPDGENEDEEYQTPPKAKSVTENIMSQIKPSYEVDADTGEIIMESPVRRVVADVKSSKLNAMLNSLKSRQQ